MIIDGAHVIGHINLDIKKIGCDFYMSNIHKWGFCPRSAAILYVDKKH